MFRNAIPHLERSDALVVLEAWIEWIEGSLTERLPEDYGLGVGELLLRITNQDSEARRALLPRLLRETDTSFRVTVVSDMVNEWGKLDLAERTALLQILQEPRMDRRWVQAAALTVKDPPWEIMEEILGDQAVLFFSEEEITTLIPGDLLHACLSMHTGHPQPLWWIGLHHRSEEPWESLLLDIARDPRHALFDLAIGQLLWRAAGREERRGEERVEIWKELCRSADPQMCARLFDHILRLTATYTKPALLEYWESLFYSPGGVQLFEVWVDRIVDALRDIEGLDNLDLFLRIGAVAEALLERFPVDRSVLMLLAKGKRLAKPEFKERLSEQYERNPPRLLWVHDAVLHALEGERDSPDPVVQRVWQMRHEWFAQRDQYNDRWSDHYELEDWVWASRSV